MRTVKRITLILTMVVVMATTSMGSVLSAQAQTYDPYQTIDPYQSELSNDNYYTNVDGEQVHSPAYSTDGSVPQGATAECQDGTYSFSEHSRGTCSSHGGIWQWL